MVKLLRKDELVENGVAADRKRIGELGRGELYRRKCR
jgi:hypothetical protein